MNRRPFVSSLLTVGLVLVGLVLATAGCAPDPVEPLPIGPSNGWEVMHPRPVGHDLNAVWGASATDVWAVGQHGVIVHWDGERVRRVDSPTRTELVAIAARSAGDIFAVGGQDVVHFDGRTWRLAHRLAEGTIRDAALDAAGRLHLVGDMGLVVHEDGGWRTIAGPGPASRVIWAGPEHSLWIGDGTRLWRLRDGRVELAETFDLVIHRGDGWYLAIGDGDHDRFVRFSATDGWQVDPSAISFSLHALLDRGVLVHADNGGVYAGGRQSWPNTDGRWIYGLAPVGDAGVLASGYGGMLMMTDGIAADGTAEWREAAETLGYRAFNALAGTGCDDIWAAEWWSRVLHFDGETWTREYTTLPANDVVHGVQTLGDGRVAAWSLDDVVLRDPAGGWTDLDVPDGNVLSVLGGGDGGVLVATRAGILDHDASGWTVHEVPDARVRSLVATPSGTIFALVDGDVTTLCTWDGADLTAVAELPPGLVGVTAHASRSSETVWVVAFAYDEDRRAAILRHRDGELRDITATRRFPAAPTRITELREDDLFVLASNELWRWRDGVWAREEGLPYGETYSVLWSHPDCGVLVNGTPTYIKAF